MKTSNALAKMNSIVSCSSGMWLLKNDFNEVRSLGIAVRSLLSA